MQPSRYRLRRSTAGLTHTEYLILLTVIAVASIAIAGLFGKQIKAAIYGSTSALQGGAGLDTASNSDDSGAGGGDTIGGGSGSDPAGTGETDGGQTPAEKKVQYPITLYGQPTGMTCWSAATTMLLGGLFSAGPGTASTGSDGGLNPSYGNLQNYAKSYDLTLYAPQTWSVQGLTGLLDKGPIMVAGYIPSGHMVVVGGYRSGGTADNTYLTVYDPWPPGKGKTYEVNYFDWLKNYPEATTYILQK